MAMRAGRLKANDPAALAIRDKSNLVLGTLLFEASAFGPSQHSLDRIRLGNRRFGFWLPLEPGNF